MTNEQRQRLWDRNVEALDNIAVMVNDSWTVISNPDGHCTLAELTWQESVKDFVIEPIRTMHQNAMHDYLMDLRANDIYFNEK
jgi:hypothetical protein